MSKTCCDLEAISKALNIIADKNRLCILHLLKTKELCVCEIWRQLKLPQNLASHHLKILTKHGFLKARKEGRWIYYSLNRSAFRQYANFLKDFN